MSAAQDLLILLEVVSGFKNPEDSDFDENLHSATHWGQQPDSPDRCITLKDVGGPADLHTHSDGETERPQVQVLVRAKTGSQVWADAEAAKSALKGYNLTLGGSVYQAIQLQSSLADLGRDSRNRREVSFLLQLHRSA